MYETSGQLVFVHFLEEIEDTKKTFQNYLLKAFSRHFLFLTCIVFTSFPFSNFDMQRFHEFSAKNDLFTSRVLTKYLQRYQLATADDSLFLKVVKKLL